MVMKPKPSPFKLLRIGGNTDGAYLLPDDLQGIKACFSPGASNRKDFEDQLTDDYDIACHMCDKTSDSNDFATPFRQGKQTFKKLWLDINDADDSITLEKWVSELAPDQNDDLILQMDIEGAEYRNILATPDRILRRFRIMVIELHNLGVAKDEAAFQKALGPTLQRLDKHFICVHAHPNNCCGEFTLPGSNINIPNVHELTFLRRDRFVGGNRSGWSKPSMPHPLDIRRNVISKAPIFLNNAWHDGPPSADSTIKMLEDKLDYSEYSANSEGDVANATISRIYELTKSIASELNENTIFSPKDDALTEIADGRPYFLSSRWGSWPDHGFVKLRDPFFFHTSFGSNQYITIDLGREVPLHTLAIGNRTDACMERAKYLFWTVHNDITPRLNEGYPVNTDDSFCTIGEGKSETPLMQSSGRYLTIFSPIRTALHFSQVQVLAHQSDD
jgi:hypothetical protein